MRKFNTVVFGATALSAGLSVNLSENDLIIEKNIFSGAEFAQSYNAKQIDFLCEYTDITKQLLDELKKRNILGDDGCYSSIPLSAVLSERFLNSKANILLDCIVTSVEKAGSSYIIEYFGESGLCRIEADNIIDTTDVGVFGELSDVPAKYYLANIVGCNNQYEDFEVLKGHFNDEFYLKASAAALDYIDARKKLVSIAEENSFKIAAFSALFSYDYNSEYTEKKDEKYFICPSASFENFALAFDFGVKGVCTE